MLCFSSAAVRCFIAAARFALASRGAKDAPLLLVLLLLLLVLLLLLLVLLLLLPPFVLRPLRLLLALVLLLP